MRPVGTVDYHTAGEPFRIVVDGGPDVPGATVLERRLAAPLGEADAVRRLLCNEPRGHADMYGCFLVPPDDDGADLGVLFWHKDGFSTACGHGTIALAAWAVEAGVVTAPTDGEADVVLDVPSGRVTARVGRAGGRTTGIAFRNVASWVAASGLRVETSAGRLGVDVAYGGAFYASVRAADAGLAPEPEQLPRLVELSAQVKAALRGSAVVEHPAEPGLGGLYGVTWWADEGAIEAGGLRQRNVTVFADGEVDRSPCGSGTSARLALLDAAGTLPEGAPLVSVGVVGTAFLARVVDREPGPAGRPAVVTEVAGAAYETGRSTFVLDPQDPLGTGFQLR